MCVLTLRRSRGRTANTAAVQPVADRTLWCMADRLQEIHITRDQNSTSKTVYLEKDGEAFQNECPLLHF